uniref:Camphor resistance CrcB family protein n=1 Tax=Populus alba TaxID=43335 RepID=A0A4U5QY45_POPAL|nr:camphor resistance CrcB family protein [Populus alba]
MDHETNEAEPDLSGSFCQTSSVGSPVSRRSLILPRSLSFQVDDDIESENVSETEDILLRTYGLWTRDSTALDTRSPVSLLPEEIIPPVSIDVLVCSEEKQEDKEKAFALPPSLEYISCLVYLAVFGILGVFTRYMLQKLFGPGVAGVTSDNYPLFLGLSSNMVGSFLMGWWGVVFKGDISRVSDHLAIGLTTGYLGSLATFSGWNQQMLDLSVDGHWVFSFVGFLIGFFLAAYAIKLGVGTAKCSKSFLEGSNRSSDLASWRVDNRYYHLGVLVALVVILGLLWSVSWAMLKKEYKHDSGRAQLWLACIVAPPGVWIRWFLARFNGRGLGKAGSLKWVPFGTLIANVSSACIMAALSTVKKAVHTRTCDTISTGIQFGFLGCLSTIPTFIAEYNAMEESQKNWRAYAYALMTITVSFGLGILIYSVPVWTRGYK